MKFHSKSFVARPSLAASSPAISARCSEVPAANGEQGCSRRPQAGKPPLRGQGQRGIALVVTLILLTVITFLAVAFLFLSQRERGAVITTVDMTTARLAAEAATERAKAETIARIISTTNEFNYGLIVSTNYFNPLGFQRGITTDNNNFGAVTNVNYFLPNGFLLNAGNPNPPDSDLAQNIANLFYDPRPPVFVDTNRLDTPPANRGPLDFRFWLDLNRNGLFEGNGRQPVVSDVGSFYDTNGGFVTFQLPPPGNVLSNSYVGDPEWIGLLERPDRPHGPNNRFVSRMAFALVPDGKTLDINNLHNQSKRINVAQDGYLRNMGVSPFEMNLAAFLVDLNTNTWCRDKTPAQLQNYYQYETNLPTISRGVAFEDATALTRYRYAGNFNNLRSVRTLYGFLGADAFLADFADGYAAGPLMNDTFLPGFDPDAPNRVNIGWPGADSTNRYSTMQDLFDYTKTGPGLPAGNNFTDRLINSGLQGPSSYDRYTYYRLLSQLGTDSGPEPVKMHLNYKNVVNGEIVPNGQTNFVPWQPLDFFTNAADRMLRKVFSNQGDNRRQFGVNDVLSLTNVPVMVSNTFVYSPAIHRVFQMAANITDASTNYTVARGGANQVTGDLPSVFRPVFETRNNGGSTDIYIRNWVEVGVPTTADLSAPLDLNEAAEKQAVLAASQFNGNLFGVPWVVGAKKGYPNFNEFAVETISQITRKLQLVKPTVNSRTILATNQMFILGISNAFGFELWNSYRTEFPRDVDIYVTNEMAIYLNYTNNAFGNLANGLRSFPFVNMRFGVRTNINASTWAGYGNIKSANPRSFQVPLRTNINFLPEAIYRMNPPNLVSVSQSNAIGPNLLRGFETGLGFPIPEFSLSVSNRIRVMMIDRTTGRMIDYVQLNDLNSVRDLTDELTNDRPGNPTEGNAGSGQYIFWDERRAAQGNIFSPPAGVSAQIQASLGSQAFPTDWQSYGVGQASGLSRNKEIDAFRVFMGLGALSFPGTVNTNSIMQAPFTPTRRFSQHLTWQANDPLIHFNVGDLQDLQQTNAVTPLSTKIATFEVLKNLGRLNDRFEPWGGRPVSSALESSKPRSGIGAYGLEAKDPGIYASDDWAFPTNKYPSVGWLGRVHRGTPWQTVYLKSSDVNDTSWAKWTGNSNRLDAARSEPKMDRVLFDVFTAAFDDDSTRGQLNVNQNGLAAWSAALSGVIALTNTATDSELTVNPPQPRVDPYVIDPAGIFDDEVTNTVVGSIWAGVNRTRGAAPFRGSFQHLGDVLAAPELTVRSPLLNQNSDVQRQRGIDDATYERLPQMLMGMLRGDDQPRFAIYAYGQTLKPANRSVLTSGPFAGMCTNYQITAEFATRTVVRIEGAPNAPRAVVESFNILPPDE